MKIGLLYGGNYQTWKYSMKSVLMERGLWGFIAGNEEVAADTATASIQNAYPLRSDKIHSLKALNVEKKFQVDVSTTTVQKLLGKFEETIPVRIHFPSSSTNSKILQLNDEGRTNILEHLTYYDHFISSLNVNIEELKWEIVKAFLFEEHWKRNDILAKQSELSDQHEELFSRRENGTGIRKSKSHKNRYGDKSRQQNHHMHKEIKC